MQFVIILLQAYYKILIVFSAFKHQSFFKFCIFTKFSDISVISLINSLNLYKHPGFSFSILKSFKQVISAGIDQTAALTEQCDLGLQFVLAMCTASRIFMICNIMFHTL